MPTHQPTMPTVTPPSVHPSEVADLADRVGALLDEIRATQDEISATVGYVPPPSVSGAGIAFGDEGQTRPEPEPPPVTSTQDVLSASLDAVESIGSDVDELLAQIGETTQAIEQLASPSPPAPLTAPVVTPETPQPHDSPAPEAASTPAHAARPSAAASASEVERPPAAPATPTQATPPPSAESRAEKPPEPAPIATPAEDIHSIDEQLAKLTDELLKDSATSQSTAPQPEAAPIASAPAPAAPAQPVAAAPQPTPAPAPTAAQPASSQSAPPAQPAAHAEPATVAPSRPKLAAGLLASIQPRALTVVSLLSKPLAGKPDAVRQTVGWVAVVTMFMATALWGIVLARSDAAEPAAAGAFDFAQSSMPEIPAEHPKEEAGAAHGEAKGEGEHASGGGHESSKDAKKDPKKDAKKPPPKKPTKSGGKSKGDPKKDAKKDDKKSAEGGGHH